MEALLILCGIGLFFVVINFSSRMQQQESKFLIAIADLKIRIHNLEQKLLGQTVSPGSPEVTKPIVAEAKAHTPPPQNEIANSFPALIPQPLKPIPTVSPQAWQHHQSEVQKPSEPGFIEKIFTSVKNYFLSGNTIVKVGVVLIFFGVSFLLKYAIDNNMIPIEIRLIACVAFAVGLVKLGWNLRSKSKDYGLVLQGGGIGILILVTFVSMKVYHLLPPTFGFLLLVFFTVVTAFLAVVQDSKQLAIFGLLGGFIAPLLASSGQGQHVVLFSYYTILNLGIFYVAWKKAWTELNFLGFVFTFVISSAWGILKYQPEFYSTTQPFLIIFFLIYASIPLIFARKNEPQLKGYIDGTLVFGNSAISLFLQLQLVKEIEYAGAFSALALAAYYVGVSRYLVKNKNPNYSILAEAFISIAIVFTTIAIPLAFDGIKTSAIWAIEAAGIYWVAIRQKRKLARYFSSALIFITAISFYFGPHWEKSNYLFLNIFYYSCLFIALSAYFISYMGDKNSSELSENEKIIPQVAFIVATIWWIGGGISEINRFIATWSLSDDLYASPRMYLNHLSLSMSLGYLAVGTFISTAVAKKIQWRKLKLLTQGFVFVMLIFFLISVIEYPHPFGSYGYLAWLASLVVFLYTLAENDSLFEEKDFLFKIGHAGFLWVIAGLLACELNWLGLQFIGESTAWRYAAQAIGPIGIVFLISEQKNLISWPIRKYHSLYVRWGLAPIVICSWYWLMFTNWFHDGNAAPLSYIPLINPLELVQLTTLLVLAVWLVRNYINSENRNWIGGFIGMTSFLWLNGVLCRTLHQYLQIPFNFSSLFAAVEVQVALSLFWTLLGIILMTFASKKQLRWLWITGASLLAIVVLKMFMIDLSKTQTIARVISFIGVGILFLIVGYFSPIPPKVAEVKG